jgi:hypothetical protein
LGKVFRDLFRRLAGMAYLLARWKSFAKPALAGRFLPDPDQPINQPEFALRIYTTLTDATERFSFEYPV